MAILKSLSLSSFRNYARQDLALDVGGVHWVHGRNGQGKSNLLEAIYFLSLLRSFRGARIEHMVSTGAEEFCLRSEVAHAGRERPGERLDVLMGVRRVLRRNGCVLGRASEFINSFRCVAMVPEDIHIVKGAAGLRRRFLDVLLAQLDPQYIHHLQAYERAVRSRNRALRELDRHGRAAVEAFDAVLAPHAASLVTARNRVCSKLNDFFASDDWLGVWQETPIVHIDYRDSLQGACAAGDTMSEKAYAGAMREALARALARDIRYGATSVGPHRDDMILRLNGRALPQCGSQGECRLVCLGLRLACVALMGDEPGCAAAGVVLLLDDVLGELDASRRQAVAALAVRADQVFVASTSAEPEQGWGAAPTVFHAVSEGSIRSRRA